MSVLLERIARRLAGEQPRSRREMLTGRHDPPTREVADPGPPSVREARAAKHRPPASVADTNVMRAAVDHAAPSRDELLTLIEALRDPASDGTFNARADKAIGGLRSELASAHRRVSAISTHSALRANVLAFLADLDAMMATLHAVGQSTDPARAARLRTKAGKLHGRVESLGHEISPALAVRRPKGGH